MLACPQCGTENPPHARYCLACGTRLEAVAPQEERKVVTVLFCDVVGFTSLAERLDPEDVRALLTPLYSLVRSTVARHGGSIEHFAGDGVMAVFGVPVAHEDDPERAVRASLAIREAVQAREEGEQAHPLAIRSGVNTGEVLISHDAHGRMVAGDAVNTAHRLQTVAPVNGILVGGDTFAATERFIEYREIGGVEVKGKAAPVPAWEALTPHSRYGPEVVREAPGPLVGRDVELLLLEELLRRTIETGEAQLVTLVSGAGLGKSRLLAEIFLRGMNASPGLVYWRQGRCPPYGERAAYSALGDMVRAQAGILDTDSAEEAGAKLRAAIERLEGEPDWLEQHLRPLVGLAGDASGERPEEAQAAWRRFFEALAEDRPLVLVVEDLQWADDGLLDFLDALVDRVRHLPICVVCTARPELLERRPGWGGGKRNATTIALEALGAAESEELARLLLGGGEARPDDVRTVVTRAEGNPLYVEEFARMLRERRLEGTADEAPLPLSVQGIVAARLDALPPEEKALLLDASVVGKLFWEGALAALADTASHDRRPLLRSLERRELIRRDRSSSVAGEEQYAFRHALVREVAYRLLPRARRAQKHLLASAWIEELARGRDDHAEARAEHYLSALTYGAGDDRVATRARVALREAADRARILGMPGRAVELYRQALASWPEADPERAHVVLALGHALYRHDQTGEDELDAARAALAAAGDRETAAEADVALALAHYGHGRRDEATACLERAADLLRLAPPSRAKVYVLSTLASFHLLADRREAALAIGGQALEMADLFDDAGLIARALRIVGAAQALSGDPAGLAKLEEAVEMARSIRSFEIVPALTNLGGAHIARGELREAFARQAEALEQAERFADAMSIRWLTAEQVLEGYWCGRWDDALALSERLLAASDGSYMDGMLRVVRARIALARRETARAEDEADRALEVAGAARDSQFLLPALAVAARVRVELGTGDPRVLLDELLARGRGDEVEVGSHWPDLAAALHLLGRGDDLLAVVERVSAPTRWVEAARAVGRGDLEEAAALSAAIGSRPAAGWAVLRARPDSRSALEFLASVGAASAATAA